MATVGRKGLLGVQFQATVHTGRKDTAKGKLEAAVPSTATVTSRETWMAAYHCSAQVAVFIPTEFRVPCLGDSAPQLAVSSPVNLQSGQSPTDLLTGQADLDIPQWRLDAQVILDCGKLTFPTKHHTSEPPQLCHLFLVPGLLKRCSSVPPDSAQFTSPTNTLTSLFINKGYISRKSA